MRLTSMDYPDPDVIRVGDTFYMVSTTMYFMPGCEILKSYDLVNWEHAAYVYDRLDSTPAQCLDGDKNIYGQGMWAASLRFHDGRFYVCFVANDTHKTYLYTSADIRGPWTKHLIDGFYHDNSILFDDDGRVYIVYGNREIRLTELASDLSGLRPGGIDKVIIRDRDDAHLGYEGSHFYKINGRYYIFVINIPHDTGKRSESCFMSDTVDGEYFGFKVMDDDLGFHGSGVAQGGIVDTPDGKWYAILFQDSGAVGRIPHLMPVTWDGDVPVFGENGLIPAFFDTPDLNPGYVYSPLVGSDDFRTEDLGDSAYDSLGFRSFWQFNHEPEPDVIRRDHEAGTVRITTDKICSNVTQALNTLTQRTVYPVCSARVTLDGSGLKEGDHAGLCMLESEYAFIGLNRHEGQLRLVVCRRDLGDVDFRGERHDTEPPEISAEMPVYDDVVTIGVHADFTDMKDEAVFCYGDPDRNEPDAGTDCCAGMITFGPAAKLKFRLDHFTGVRFALFVYSTEQTGGYAEFSDFERT
ncbi:MAG: glycoside hydrolase 43 family protein [Lachnospiraceae bacterium]|nr:glycoside hydrolase 43 family protein [Lachnospiraceae bacterium]